MTQEGPRPPSTPTPSARRPRPRLSVQHRLVIWVMAVAAMPVGICAFFQYHITHNTLAEGPAESVGIVSRTAAAALSDRVQYGWSSQAESLIDALARDPRIALVVVYNADKQVLHRRSIQAKAQRMLYDAGLSEAAFAVDIGKTRTLGKHNELALLAEPIWSAPLPGKERKLQGYVLAGVYDKSAVALAQRLNHMQMIVVFGSLLLVLPAVAFASRRSARPLQRLLEATHALADGEQAPPVPSHRGDEIGLLGEAFNGMAQRLQAAHRELRGHNDNLENIITQRTAELEQANQQLAEQNAEKDAFLRSVSHDLNAPLRNIDGMAAMVLRKHRDTLDEDVIRKLERICANVKQETELINGLVELSRLRTTPPAEHIVDLNELVGEVFAGLGHQVEEARIQTRIEGTLPTIKAERTRIRQVLQNLIDNAAKYMMDSKVRQITVRAEEDLHFYRIAVQDTGRGIAWEDQPKVFGVFQRSTRSGTHQVQGKGVGLASVKSIVEGYGGQIWVDSELGKGSTFHFTLAREKVSPPLPAALKRVG